MAGTQTSTVFKTRIFPPLLRALRRATRASAQRFGCPKKEGFLLFKMTPITYFSERNSRSARSKSKANFCRLSKIGKSCLCFWTGARRVWLRKISNWCQIKEKKALFLKTPESLRWDYCSGPESTYKRRGNRRIWVTVHMYSVTPSLSSLQVVYLPHTTWPLTVRSSCGTQIVR